MRVCTQTRTHARAMALPSLAALSLDVDAERSPPPRTAAGIGVLVANIGPQTNLLRPGLSPGLVFTCADMGEATHYIDENKAAQMRALKTLFMQEIESDVSAVDVLKKYHIDNNKSTYTLVVYRAQWEERVIAMQTIRMWLEAARVGYGLPVDSAVFYHQPSQVGIVIALPKHGTLVDDSNDMHPDVNADSVMDCLALAAKQGHCFMDIRPSNMCVHEGRVRLLNYDLSRQFTITGSYAELASQCINAALLCIYSDESFGLLGKTTDLIAECRRLDVFEMFAINTVEINALINSPCDNGIPGLWDIDNQLQRLTVRTALWNCVINSTLSQKGWSVIQSLYPSDVTRHQSITLDDYLTMVVRNIGIDALADTATQSRAANDD